MTDVETARATQGHPSATDAPEAPHGLPDNAFRELAPGETYRPIVPPESALPEVTTRSILFGLAMTAIFSLAVAYVALPELTVRPTPQEYTLLERRADGARWRFRSLDSDFTAELSVDGAGLVRDYPGIARRLR